MTPGLLHVHHTKRAINVCRQSRVGSGNEFFPEAIRRPDDLSWFICGSLPHSSSVLVHRGPCLLREEDNFKEEEKVRGRVHIDRLTILPRFFPSDKINGWKSPIQSINGRSNSNRTS